MGERAAAGADQAASRPLGPAMGTDRPKRTGIVALRLDIQGQPARE